MLLALAAAAVLAAPPGFYEAKVLEPAASYVAGKPAAVWCARDATAWRVYLDATYGASAEGNGSAEFGGVNIYLSRSACENLKARLPIPYYVGLAPSILTITHEAIHLRGERNEGVTDCAAVHEMPGVAVRFFRIRPGKQLRALMAAAWVYRAKESAVYRAAC